MSIRLDKRFPFSSVYGHEVIKYEQGGLNFDKFGDLVILRPQRDVVIEHEHFLSALEFLKQVLRSGAVSKAAIYKAAEENNQQWSQVKLASQDPQFTKFKFSGAEWWKLKDGI